MCSRHEQLPHVIGVGAQWATTNVRQKATVVHCWLTGISRYRTVRVRAEARVTRCCCWTGRATTAISHWIPSAAAPCRLRGVMRPWFDFWFRRDIYCLLVYMVCSPTYPFFFTFPCLSPPLLVFSFENPLCFHAGCRKRRLNLALVFVFILCCSTFDWWLRVFLVLGLVFSIPSQETGLGKRLQNDLFCVERDVKAQFNQSIHLQLKEAFISYLWGRIGRQCTPQDAGYSCRCSTVCISACARQFAEKTQPIKVHAVCSLGLHVS